MGVYKLFSEGKTGCMVYISQDGFESPLYLKDLQDPATGKIPPRLVNIDSDKIQQVIDNLMKTSRRPTTRLPRRTWPTPKSSISRRFSNW